MPTTFARAFTDELDLSTRESMGSILELLLKRANKDSVSACAMPLTEKNKVLL